MRESYPLYLAGRAMFTDSTIPVVNKFTGESIARVSLAHEHILDQAIAAGQGAERACRKLSSFARSDVLNHVASRLQLKQDEFARVLAIEAGKPIRDARGEIVRAIETFQLGAEEALRIRGEYLPLDLSRRTEGYQGIWKRVPIGLCSFIAPFNFPINLAAHKIAPAIAAGCPFILKPASLTPISAILLGEILAETEWPHAGFSMLPCRRESADLMATDQRFKLLSFTGSPQVGWALKARAGKKSVILELGGNAACIVDRDADLTHATARIIIGAFYQSGQSCISVQRILVHESIYDDFKARLVAAANVLKSGDPLSEETFLGPLITEQDAMRVEEWVRNAVAQGAEVLCGGARRGSFFDATLLERVPDSCELGCREVFGPVAIIEPFATFEHACRRVNASDFGLQAGVFTNNLQSAFYAFDELEVGGVVINDVPSFRADAMPYGGVKDSGLGREGVRFAIEHMTEMRLLVLNRIGERPE
ncbi:MAG: aldehyde dehydrogenase family protein [Phycisphaerae bacterium]|nr:aldehyde dehydrogenase family protein [Phycisphaerae bacterium]